MSLRLTRDLGAADDEKQREEDKEHLARLVLILGRKGLGDEGGEGEDLCLVYTGGRCVMSVDVNLWCEYLHWTLSLYTVYVEKKNTRKTRTRRLWPAGSPPCVQLNVLYIMENVLSYPGNFFSRETFFLHFYLVHWVFFAMFPGRICRLSALSCTLGFFFVNVSRKDL